MLTTFDKPGHHQTGDLGFRGRLIVLARGEGNNTVNECVILTPRSPARRQFCGTFFPRVAPRMRRPRNPTYR